MMLLSYLRRQTSDVRRQFDFIVVVRYVAWRRVLGIDVRVQMSDVRSGWYGILLYVSCRYILLHITLSKNNTINQLSQEVLTHNLQ